MTEQGLVAFFHKIEVNGAELRRFVRDFLPAAQANRAKGLPGEVASDDAVIDAAAHLLFVHLGDNTTEKQRFFAALREAFPNHAAAIQALAGPPPGLRKIRVAVVRTPAGDVDPAPILARLKSLAPILTGGEAQNLILGRDALDAELLILLLGPKHGGQGDTLTRLVEDERCLGIAIPYDADEVDADPGVKELRRRLNKADPDLPAQVHAMVHAWHQEHFPPRPGGDPTLLPWERAYLEDRAHAWGVGDAGVLGVLLERAERVRWYVHLRASKRMTRRDEFMWLKEREFPDDEEVWETILVDALEGAHPAPFLDELLGDPQLPRAVVVGGAGAGKSTLLTHLAWTLAQHHLERPLTSFNDEPPHHLDLDALAKASPRVPVPILCTATTLVALLRGPDGKPSRPIRQGLERLLREEIFPATPFEELRAGLDAGRYWFLVDSLDEVPLRTDRAALVTALGSATELRLTLSTRPMAHTDVELPKGFGRVDISPLDDDRIAALTRALLRASGREERDIGQALQAIAATRRDFPTDEEGRSPAENPLLLATMALLWHKHGSLPDDRALLYGWMIQLLCETRAKGADDECREHEVDYFREDLWLLALEAQESWGTAMPVSAACAALVNAQREKDRPTAQARLERIVHRTGLFHFRDEGATRVLRPWHRSFQEYLAARKLAANFANRAEACIDYLRVDRPEWGPRLLDPTWIRTLRFLVGAFGEVSEPAARQLVEAWLDEADKAAAPEARLLALAGGGFAEYERRLFRSQWALKERLRTRIHEGFAARGVDWPWEDRLDALEALGRLGDPRLPDPRVVEGLTVENGWAAVPSGEYAVGGGVRVFNPLPAGRVTLPAFFLRVWPVTVAEFEPFVESGAIEDPSDWADGRHQDQGLPPDWLEQRRRPNRPVTGVDWFTARAFCAWANGAWRLPVGGVLDLPTSAEWEVAARRGTGRIYPWDTDPKNPLAPNEGDRARAAYKWHDNPFAQRGATPVGAFPRGHSPEGLWDLAGNVWEWLATILGEREHNFTGPLRDKIRHHDDKTHYLSQKSPRLLIGGSWVDISWWLHAARRGKHPPERRSDNIGFRVVFRPPR